MAEAVEHPVEVQAVEVEAPIPAWDTVVARLPIAFVMPNVSNTMTVAQTMLKSV